MQIKISQRTLAAILHAAKAVADTSAKATMPILGSIVLRGRADGSLQALATNMSVSLCETTEADVVRPGACAASVKRLAEIVAVIPSSAEITMAALDNHWIRLTTGRSEFKLMGSPDTDFPTLPEPHAKATEYVVDTKAWLDLFDRVGYAMSSDEARINLNGALVEADGSKIKVVATDGHRLATYQRPLEGLTLNPGIVLPKSGIETMAGLLKRAGETVTLVIDPASSGNQRCLFVKTATSTFSMRVSNVTFPPYKQVIPGSLTREVRVDKAEFEGALRRAVVMAPERTATVALTFGRDSIEIDANNPDLGATHQEIDATLVRGEPCTAGFNARYLLEVIGTMDGDTVTIQGHNELDPLLFGGDDQIAVVMPMRI
jgi:DNA polymerase-3 subunit beta